MMPHRVSIVADLLQCDVAVRAGGRARECCLSRAGNSARCSKSSAAAGCNGSKAASKHKAMRVAMLERAACGCRSALRFALIVVPGEKLLEVIGDGVTREQPVTHADDVLKIAVGGISEISDTIHILGLANVGFEDVKNVMSELGVSEEADRKRQTAAGATQARSTRRELQPAHRRRREERQ